MFKNLSLFLIFFRLQNYKGNFSPNGINFYVFGYIYIYIYTHTHTHTHTHVYYYYCTNNCIGEGNGTPLQYSCLENSMDGGAWWTAVHEVAKSRTQLSDFTFTFSLSCIGEGNGNPLQCSCLENPRDGKPGGLLSMGSHRVGLY